MKTNNKIYVTTYAVHLTPADFNTDLLMLELADHCVAVRPCLDQVYITTQSNALTSADINNIILKCQKEGTEGTAAYQLINIGTFGPFKK